LRLRPDWAFALQTLARILATHPDPVMRDGNDAVKLAERACELAKQPDANQLDTLGAAYAEAGRFADAISAAQKALDRAPSGQSALATEIQRHLNLYRAEKPFHQGD
jgi:tetratricopeptide (TPR) repeat protein